MGQSLVLFVYHFPFLFQCGDHLVLLRLIHKEFLTVHLCLLLNLHLPYELVLVFDFLLDSLQVLGHLAVVLLIVVLPMLTLVAVLLSTEHKYLPESP